MAGGSSGGGGTTNTSNIPAYARPYVESMLGATQKQLFNTTTDPVTGKVSLDSFKEYKPYSQNVQDYFAPMSRGQNQAYGEALNMQTPGQFGAASNMAGEAGAGGFSSVAPAYGYGSMGAGYGQQGAGIGLGALGYGQGAANIGQMGVGAAQQGFGAGERFARQATDPNAVSAYMSPYMQNVVDTQKAAAVRDYQMAMPQLSAQAARAGAFGGARDSIQRAEAARNLTSQLQNIQAQGTQQAFQNAQAQQQFGANLGLQGLQAGYQGLQTGIQGQQAGMQGIQGALAGTAQGMQGAQTGLQGVNAAQAGYGLANQAASNLANIGTAQQQADVSRINLTNTLGQQQQAYQQQLYNQAIQDYATQQQYPLMQLGFMSNMLRGLPMQSTSTQTYMPAGQQLMGYGLGALGAAKAFG